MSSRGPDEAAVVVDCPQETSEFLDGGGGLCRQDGFDLFLLWPDARLVDKMAEEVERCFPEDALFAVDGEAVLVKNLEDLSEVFQMFFLVEGSDEYVVEVYKHVRDVSQDGIHHPLEILSSIL